MQRFECHGQLILRINMETCKAKIQIKHLLQHERPLTTSSVPPEVVSEIQNNFHLDPLQLRTHLSTLFDLRDITNKQIYYWWSVATEKTYQKDKNPVRSAILLLKERFKEKGCILLMSLHTESLTAIAFSSPCLIYLKEMVKEIHVDATYKTAKGRFELYAIIGQYQGTGFALGYLILDVIEGSNNLDMGKTTILTEFFSKFKNLGLSPEYVFSDKDFSQINAAKNVWPSANIQLCLWHIKKAIVTKMKSNQRGKYKRFTAFELADLNFVDPNFVPTNANNDTVCPITHQDNVLNLVERHFNLHPLIPFGPHKTFLTAEEIWKTAVREIYQFCHKHAYPELWNYLFFSWYTKNRWNLWARSTNPTIPFGKTNMIIEAHWKVVKHDYLYRFNRPRIDYVVFVLCEKVASAQTTRLHQLANGRVSPYWWENFKRAWKRCAIENIAVHVEERYYSDVDKWICSCPAFLYIQ